MVHHGAGHLLLPLLQLLLPAPVLANHGGYGLVQVATLDTSHGLHDEVQPQHVTTATGLSAIMRHLVTLTLVHIDWEADDDCASDVFLVSFPDLHIVWARTVATAVVSIGAGIDLGRRQTSS